MKRNKLLSLIERYNPSLDEVQAKQEIINFIKNNENCFDRELSIGHITGSSWLLNKEGDKALLLHHNKLDRWFQLGGHADGESDILAVAIKEAMEESGINAIEPVISEIFDIDVHKIPANSKENEHYHYDIRFLLQVKSDETILLNSEAKELRWISKDKKDLPTDENSVVRMFDKWLLFSGVN